VDLSRSLQEKVKIAKNLSGFVNENRSAAFKAAWTSPPGKFVERNSRPADWCILSLLNAARRPASTDRLHNSQASKRRFLFRQASYHVVVHPIRKFAVEASRFRRYWALAPGIVFLNHGSFGACSAAILRLQEKLRRQMEAEPVQFLWRTYDERLETSRVLVAQFVGARPRDLVFVTNATTGINAVLRSLSLRPGDELLTTNHDYNACHNALVDTVRRAKARLVTAQVPFPVRSADQVLQAVLASVTRRTRLALIDHVTSSTALVFPVTQIVRELERRGIDTLVDGAHAPGMVPLDLSKLAPAYYAANLHKWVCAPKGSAFLWVREDKQRELQPAVISHGNNTPRPGYSPFQDRFDWVGTFDPSAWLCAGEAIRWMERLLPGGWRSIRRANKELIVRARKLLCEKLGVEALCPDALLGSMVTLPLPARFQGRPRQGKIDPEQSRLYDEFGIEVPFFRIGRPEKRYFRVSAQLYNSAADYENLANALSSLEL
jgi:isopenicillin-N epimerase